MGTKTTAKRTKWTVAALQNIWFDKSAPADGGLVAVRCSRCVAVVYDGTPHHQPGCANARVCCECGRSIVDGKPCCAPTKTEPRSESVPFNWATEEDASW